MTDSISQLIAACEWYPVSFFIISGNVFDPLIYYSHLLPLISSLALGIFLITQAKKQLAPKIFFGTIILLAIWLIGDLITWATDQPRFTMFFWSIINMVEPIIYAGTLYFLYVFIDQKDISFWKKLLISIPLVPTIVLAFTQYGLTQFDLSTCDRDAFEGPLASYGYFVEMFFVAWGILLATSRFIKNKSPISRKQIALVSIGSLGFLLAFAFGNIVGSWFSDLNILGEDYSWSIGQYGIFGVPVFLALLSYLIVAYKSFNTKVFGAQILVGGLVILIGSEFFFIRSAGNRILVSITFILALVFGYLLLKSVKKEIEARKHLETLTKDLQRANNRLKELDAQKTEFISLATHQIRGPLGSIKGYISMILEGDYGPFPETAKKALDVVMRSTQALVIVVGDYLDVSRIEQGRMKFDFSDFDMKELVTTTVGEVKPVVEAANLPLFLDCDLTQTYRVHGDMGKIKQVVGNLLDNSIKYTKQGQIHISLTKKDGKVIVAIKDTGVGIKKEVMPLLFNKFSRAPDASKTNIMGTGLGLFVAKKIMEAHGGNVWAESEGEGKGSQFYVELAELK